ncbi:50S ribosomal protein L4, partial [gut metagenome]
MPVIALLNQAGEQVSELTLNDEIFGIEPNKQVIYDVVNAQRAAMRQGTHDVKNRSEVRGGGRKPWRQKGTGRARQGSIRAPQWRGGGTVFGPTPRSYAFKLNKKVKQLGLKSTLSYKVQNEKLIAVDTFVFDTMKTKNFLEFLNNIKATGKTIVVCSREELTDNAIMSARNIPNVFLTTADNASVYEILCFDKLVV